VPTGRERDWLGEWEEEREDRQLEQRRREARDDDEPAYRLLAGAHRARQVFLVLKCERYFYEEDYIPTPCGRPVLVFTSAARANEYRHALPGHGEWQEPDNTGEWSRSTPISHRVVELPLGKWDPAQPREVESHPLQGDKLPIVFRTRGQEEEGEPLAAFKTANEAEEFKEECVKAYQATRSPFEFALKVSTSFPDKVLRDWILDLGLEPPPVASAGFRDWQRWLNWWSQVESAVTDWQRAQIWQVMDRIQPYTVITVDGEQL
jgi:hypothetical protein